MSKEAFYSLLDRYLKGKCSEEEKKLVEQWYAMLDDEAPEIKESELALISTRMKDKLEEEINPSDAFFPEHVRSRRMPVFAIAASVVGILIAVGYLISEPIEKPGFVNNSTTTIFDERNETSEPMKVILSDGSVVTLTPGSTLKYPQEFGRDKREVQLTGTAFFEIARDTEHPFRVFSEGLVTQVLGTSFTIQSDERSHNSEVSVRTGKVSVSRNAGEQSIIRSFLSPRKKVVLLPNQRVTYAPKKEPDITLVDNPQPVINEDKQSIQPLFDERYSESPLSVILSNLSKIYGVTVVTEDTAVNQCTFTGDLTGEDLKTQLTFICRSSGLSYRVEGTTIVVQGKGCAGNSVSK